MTHTEQANDILKQDGFKSAHIRTRVLLTAEAREWDARRLSGEAWPSLSTRHFNKKTGRYEMSDAASTSNKAQTAAEKVSWFTPEGFQTKDGRPITSMMLRPKDGKHSQFHISRYKATAEEVAWAKVNGFSIPKKLDHGKPWWETGAAYSNEHTGTGSKDAAQSPIWGYKLPKVKVPFLNLKHRIDNYVGPIFMQPMVLPEFLAGEKYTPCVPSKDEVTAVLPRGTATQLSLFGVRSASTSRKCQLKDAALNRSLNEAFGPRDIRPCELFEKTLHLSSDPDDEVGNSWTPVTAAPIDSMIEQEEMESRVRRALAELERLQTLLGKDKFKMIGMSAQGMTNKEISDELRSQGKDVSPTAVRVALQRVRKQLQEVA